jgi:hypothetical protein
MLVKWHREVAHAALDRGRHAGAAGQPRPAAAYAGLLDLDLQGDKVPVVDSEFADVSVEVA